MLSDFLFTVLLLFPGSTAAAAAAGTTQNFAERFKR